MDTYYTGNMTSTAAAVKAEEKRLFSFGASHFILLVACFLALIGCVYLFDSRRADQADARAALAEQKAVSVDNQNRTLQQQTLQQIAALTAQNTALESQITNLATAIRDRDEILAQSQQAITTLSAPKLALDWGKAGDETSPDIDTTGHFLVTLPLAQKSLAALIAIPTLQQDKQDLNAELTEQHTVAANTAQALTKEQAAHVSDNAACTADKAALQAQIRKTKADARRSKLRWFVGGLVGGILTTLLHF